MKNASTKRTRRYWAFRTDRENKRLILRELSEGRLRQGWGHDESQDLRLIQAEIDAGGAWWDRLTPEQQRAQPQLRMLALAEDSIKVEDLILLPNLPDDGPFLLAEVVGDYQYQPLRLGREEAIHGPGQDYGHILPVRLLTKRGINRYSGAVHASLRSTLRTPMRMWNLDGYAAEIERLLTA